LRQVNGTAVPLCEYNQTDKAF